MNQDWGGLGGIIEEARDLDRDEKSRPLIDCPQCGTPLDKNTRGSLNCPMGHFSAPAGARRGDYS